MANIFKLHEYQKFALMKMQNRAKSDLLIIIQFMKKFGLPITGRSFFSNFK